MYMYRFYVFIYDYMEALSIREIGAVGGGGRERAKTVTGPSQKLGGRSETCTIRIDHSRRLHNIQLNVLSTVRYNMSLTCQRPERTKNIKC